jgi:hypothetical protein
MVLETISKIEPLLNRINSHDEFSRSLKIGYKEVLRVETMAHSLRIEGIEVNKYQKKCNSFRNILNARDYLLNNGISISSLAVLGNLVEPKNHPFKNFRNDTVMFGEFEPPTSMEKILYEIHNLLEILNDENLHPILKGIEAHIGIVKIHPYLDGNGRSARLVQNVLLEKYGYPVTFIPESEREVYIDLMRITMFDRFSKMSSIYNPSDSEKILHNFLTGKILSCVEDLENELLKKRQYKIILKGVKKPNIGYLIAKELRRYGKSNGKCISVGVNKKNNGKKEFELRVVGDISYRELDDKVNRYKQKKSFANYFLDKNTI